MAEYTSGAVNFAGLGNGTDFNTLIDGLIKVEQKRVTRWETWKQGWQDKVTEFQNLNTKLLSLQTTLKTMDTTNEFMKKSVSSSDTDALNATADSSAQEASHSIIINQLATNDTLITSSGASSTSTSIFTADSNFTFSYAGTSYTISNISAGTTMQTFVNTINAHPDSKDRIRASILYDGSTYHLQFTGKDLGADNQVVIGDTGSMIFSNGSFTETQNAVNAQLRVDGYPNDGTWIERSSNAVDDVITGMTLNLKEADGSKTIQVAVNTDKALIKENIRKFVDAVNEVRSKIKSLTKVDDLKKDNKGSILTGNYGVDMIDQKLKDIISSIGVGFSYYNADDGSGDLYSSLSQLGILTDANQGSATQGLLTIDEDKLDEVLDADPAAVGRLFAADNEGSSSTGDMSFYSQIDGTTKAGIYDVVITTSNGAISSATIDGQACGIDGWVITGPAGTDMAGLAVRLDNQGNNSTYTGTITIKQGKTGELVDELTELTKPYNSATNEGGPLAVLQENYKDIMESADDKIDYEKRRIDKLETRLKAQYARLDALLGTYDQKQGQLTAQISQLARG